MEMMMAGTALAASLAIAVCAMRTCAHVRRNYRR